MKTRKANGFMSLVCGLALAALAGWTVSLRAETPDRLVRYVEATGEQAVDVGVRGRYGTKMEAQIEWTALADMSILDARESLSTESRVFFAHSSGDGNISLGYGTYHWTSYKDGGNRYYYWETGRKYNVETDYSLATNIVVTESVVTNLVEDPETPGVTNEVEETQTTETTNIICKATYIVDGEDLKWGQHQSVFDLLDTRTNLYLFACNIGGTPYYKAKARCYAMKLWQDDENGNRQLVRDFKPCLKNGRAGLYDAVSETIFYSITETDLLVPNDEPDCFLDSLVTYGDTYIDTGVIGRSGTRAEADFEWLALGGDYGLLDVRGTYNGNDRILLIHSWKSGMGVGYGTFSENASHKYEVGTRYLVESDLRAGSQTVVVNGETVWNGTVATSYDTGRNLYLFANNRGGSVENKSRVRLYSLKIWQTDPGTGTESLVRDFRPCAKNGEAALYDEVSQTIFYSQQNLIEGEMAPDPAEKGFYFVEYIQANGINHLDTGVRARAGTRVAGEMQWTQLRTNKEENDYLEYKIKRDERSYLAATSGDTAAKRFYPFHERDKNFWSGYGDQGIYPNLYTTNLVEQEETDPETGVVTTNLVEQVTTSRFAMATDTRYAFDVSYAAGSQTVDINGKRIVGATAETSVDSDNSLYLFACNRGTASPSRYHAYARCYGLKIWQDGVLVRDFKPCVKDGWAMLYDTETRALYSPVPPIPAAGNVGEYQPSGEEKPEFYLDWVDTDGTQYIDTGVIGRDGTAAEFEMEWKPFVSGDDWEFLGARTSGNRRFLMWHVAKNALSFGYNGFVYPDARNPAAGVNGGSANCVFAEANHKYHVYTSLDNGSQVITTNGVTIVNRTATDGVNAGCNLYIFADNKAGTAQYFCKARLYWMRIWQDGYLVRDFRPVLLDNTLPALWDTRHNEIYYSNKPFSAIGPVGNRVVVHYGTMLFIR
ncbi:MAG: hypothetical protein IJR99_07315 [Kiritimatiellae bacterium]|nr:hypothetical protein [Kiritimatiellia bacterium]